MNRQKLHEKYLQGHKNRKLKHWLHCPENRSTSTTKSAENKGTISLAVHLATNNRQIQQNGKLRPQI